MHVRNERGPQIDRTNKQANDCSAPSIHRRLLRRPARPCAHLFLLHQATVQLRAQDGWIGAWHVSKAAITDSELRPRPRAPVTRAATSLTYTYIHRPAAYVNQKHRASNAHLFTSPHIYVHTCCTALRRPLRSYSHNKLITRKQRHAHAQDKQRLVYIVRMDCMCEHVRAHA